MTAASVPTGCLSHAGRPKRGYHRPGRLLRRVLRITAREAGLPARAYRCERCGLWHATTREAWEA